MIKITTLASSSSGNCYSVTDGHTALLIECGIRYRDIQIGLNFKMSSITGCLVSHAHKDHSGAVKEVMKAGIEVYTSQGTIEALGLTGHRLNTIQALKQFTIGSWTILPFDVIHDVPEPLGFLLQNRLGEKLLFITDSAYSPYKFSGLTHIMLEINYCEKVLNQHILDETDQKAKDLLVMRKRRLLHSHFSLENAVSFLKANDLSKVQEIHILHLSDSNSDEELIKRTIQGVSGKPVYMAQK